MHADTVASSTDPVSQLIVGALIVGLFGVLERFSAILGPLCFGLAIKATGEPRWGVVPLVAFFLVGAALLASVGVWRRRLARRSAAQS